MGLRPGQKIAQPEDDVSLLVTTGTTTAGQVLAVDTKVLNGDGEWYKTRVPEADDGDLKSGIPAVAMSNGLDGEVRSYATSGPVYAAVRQVAEAIAVGDPLYFEDGQRYFDVTAPAAAADYKVVARALEAVGSATATPIIKVMLGGISGFGTSTA